MKKGQLALVVAVTCLIAGVNLQPATAAIVNGGFETGLTDWTVSTSGGSVTVIASTGKNGESGTWAPQEGGRFAILVAGSQGFYNTLSQSFAALAGQTLSLYAFFDAGDYLPFNDDGYVNLIGTSSTTTLYARSVSHPDVGNYGSDGWQYLTHTFANSGSYQIQAGVRNVGDSGWPSWIGLDGVSLSNNVLPAVPEPAALTIWGVFGALGLVAARRRKRVA